MWQLMKKEPQWSGTWGERGGWGGGLVPVGNEPAYTGVVTAVDALSGRDLELFFQQLPTRVKVISPLLLLDVLVLTQSARLDLSSLEKEVCRYVALGLVSSTQHTYQSGKISILSSAWKQEKLPCQWMNSCCVVSVLPSQAGFKVQDS